MKVAVACPVCGGEIPGYAGTGRPRRWCSVACRRAADREIRRAATWRLLAGRQEELAAMTERGETSMWGSVAYLRGRAEELRAAAAELEARFGGDRG